MTHGKRPQFIYFDLGNVLLLFDHELAARQMAALADVPVEKVRQLVFESTLQNEYETGTISNEAFYEHFCRETNSKPDFEMLLTAASDIFELNFPIVPLVSQLASQGHRLGILSNTCDAHWQFVKQNFKLLDQFFPVNALSFEMKSMKPDASIYQQAAELADFEPANIFFTDDREENVAGAVATGIDAVQFTTVKSLVADLLDRGIQINL